ncbi:MAG: T9SS type A sorting domain-containing protein, partial [Bacteroidales bacterium]|nr:T9SS type A sorting domain-containing protein [Bacteroidales bacterium]
TVSLTLMSSQVEPRDVTVIQLGKPVGVEEEVMDDLLIFPNPTHGSIQIMSGNPINELRIYDISGRITDQLTGAGEIMLTINLEERGVYYLEIVSDQGSSLVMVIVY